MTVIEKQPRQPLNITWLVNALVLHGLWLVKLVKLHRMVSVINIFSIISLEQMIKRNRILTNSENLSWHVINNKIKTTTVRILSFETTTVTTKKYSNSSDVSVE